MFTEYVSYDGFFYGLLYTISLAKCETVIKYFLDIFEYWLLCGLTAIDYNMKQT